MLKIVIGAVVAYIVIGFIVSRVCKKNGIAGAITMMILWPAILVGSLLAGRCEKKPSTVVLSPSDGNQGAQGPQGNQGATGGAV